MKVEEKIVFILAIISVLIALLSPTLDLFFTLLLIETLIIYNISSFYINPKSKEYLKSLIYIQVIIFIFIVFKKVYEIVVK